MSDEPRPLFSIIIPCFKQAAYLPIAIDSALNQQDAAVQVIVVDDGSPDDTATVAGRYGERITLIRQPNAGVAAARNTGLAAATGTFIHFLDADDFLLPTMVATHLAAMRDNHADVTCSAWNAVDPAGQLIEFNPAPVFEPDPFHALLPENLAPPVCYVFKRAVVNAVGGFDPDRRKSGHEDWDLFLRVAATGARFVAIPQALAGYRFHAASASHRYSSMYDSGMAVVNKARASHPRCPRCGTRWRDAYAFFAYNYVDCNLRPMLRHRATNPIPWSFWKHFLLRSASHPTIFWETARYFLSAAPRRLGLTKAPQSIEKGPLASQER